MNSAAPTRDELADRLGRVDQGVADAAREAGRDAATITRIVVTKFHPAELVRELAALGVRDFGESRHQEARAKTAQLADLDVVWHFVGQLQSKKARQALEYARVVHSVDRASLVDALAGQAQTGCFVQLNLTDDPGRGGATPEDLEPLAERVLAAPGLDLLGVMAIAPLGEEPRRAFARTREAAERIRRIAPAATAISMGMSADYREAVLEGATHLRIGSAITGNRPERV